MDLSIASSILYCKSSAEIWKELEERYGHSNAPRIYQVQKELSTISQGENSVLNYFTQLKTVWNEYYSMLGLPTCTCGTSTKFVNIL